jgi:hypothetical protein
VFRSSGGDVEAFEAMVYNLLMLRGEYQQYSLEDDLDAAIGDRRDYPPPEEHEGRLQYALDALSAPDQPCAVRCRDICEHQSQWHFLKGQSFSAAIMHHCAEQVSSRFRTSALAAAMMLHTPYPDEQRWATASGDGMCCDVAFERCSRADRHGTLLPAAQPPLLF